MRIVAAKPETERLARGPRGEKGIEVLEGCSGGIVGTALIAPRSVTLAGQADKIAGGFQQIRIDCEPGGNITMEIRALFETPVPLAEYTP